MDSNSNDVMDWQRNTPPRYKRELPQDTFPRASSSLHEIRKPKATTARKIHPAIDASWKRPQKTNGSFGTRKIDKARVRFAASAYSQPAPFTAKRRTFDEYSEGEPVAYQPRMVPPENTLQSQTPPFARTELYQDQVLDQATQGSPEEGLLHYLAAGCCIAQTVLVHTVYASLALGRLGYNGILETRRYVQENRHILDDAYRVTANRTGYFARQNQKYVMETYRTTLQAAQSCKRRLIEFTTRRNANELDSPVTVLSQSPLRRLSPTRSSIFSPQRRPSYNRTRENLGAPRGSPTYTTRLASRQSSLPHSSPGATSTRLAWDAQLEKQRQHTSPPLYKDYAQMVSIHQLMDLANDESDMIARTATQGRFDSHQSHLTNNGKDTSLDDSSVSSSDSKVRNHGRSALSDLHSNSSLDESRRPLTKLKKSVRFFQSPRTGRPVDKVKTFDKISPSPISRILRDRRRRSLESYGEQEIPDSTLQSRLRKVGDDLEETKPNGSPEELKLGNSSEQLKRELAESSEEYKEGAEEASEEASEEGPEDGPEEGSEDYKEGSEESSEDSQDVSQDGFKVEDEVGTIGDETTDDIHIAKREEKLRNEHQAILPTVPSTPTTLTPSLNRLTISTRRTSERQRVLEREIVLRRAEEEARLAAEKARKEAAAAAAQAKREAAAAREAQLRAEADWKKRGSRRKPTFPLITPLPPDWDAKVDAAMAIVSLGTALATSSDGTKISRKDFGTLLPQPGRDSQSAWLNDEVVCAYLQMIVQHGLSRTNHKRGQTPKYHAFNTFFYSSLRDDGPEKVKRWAGRAKLGGASLLNAEYIFVPVHQSSHWTLVVISPVRRTIEYFDSFHGPGKRFTDNIKYWLAQELGDKWVEKEWSVYDDAGSPTQQNARDCGVFAATTARMVMFGWEPEASYWEADIGCQRRRMAAELMNGAFTGDLEPVTANEE